MNNRKPIRMQRRGQTFICNFWHPIQEKTKYVNLGDASEAEDNLRALNTIYLDESLWLNVPANTPDCIRAAWGQKFTKVEPGHAVEAVAKAAADFWKRQYEQEVRAGQLKDAELTALRGRQYGGPTQTLREALDIWKANFDTDALDRHHRANVITRLEAFVAAFQPTLFLSDLSGQELEMRAFIERRGCSVGAMRQWRQYIIRFLEESGLSVSKRAFRSWRETEKAIVWLNDEQVGDLKKKLCSYARDLFTVQVETGLRPTELPTIKASDIHGQMLTLSPLGNLTLKQGSRTIPLSAAAREVLARRLSGKKQIAFKSGDHPWPTPEWFCRQYKAWLDEAADKLQKLPKVDCRTGRRTAASLWLRRGLSVEQVAALLGDDIRTVRRHYARILPQEVTL